jgi:hypothetical protein
MGGLDCGTGLGWLWMIFILTVAFLIVALILSLVWFNLDI